MQGLDLLEGEHRGGKQISDSGSITMKTMTKRWWYELDTDDLISGVSENWDTFAYHNDGEAARAEAVVGRRIWDFVEGPETCALLRAIYERARASRTVEVPFRCDAPSTARWLMLRAEPATQGRIRIATWTVAENARAAVGLLDRCANRCEQTIRICSWCHSIWMDTEWTDLENAITRMKLLDNAPLPQLTHGICEHCTDSVMSELE